MKKMFLAILVLTVFCSGIKAEPFGSNVNQKGHYSKAKNSGCELTYIDQTLNASTLTHPLALYWVAISSPQIALANAVPDQNTYAYIESSNTSNGALNTLAKVAITSGTNATYFEFNPPIVSTQNTVFRFSTNTLSGAFCYQYKSTSPYTRFNEPVDFNDEVIDVADAGCVATTARATAAALVSTTAPQGFPTASANPGTVVYWIYGTSVAAPGSAFYVRSTNTANTSSALAIPPFFFNWNGVANSTETRPMGFDGRLVKFNPPFFVPDRISYNLGAAVQQGVIICSRGITEFNR